MRAIAAAAIVGIVVVVPIAAGAGFGRMRRLPSEADSAARVGFIDRSMEDWVGRADAIFEGTVVQVRDVGQFTGWQDDGSIATVTPASGASDPSADIAVPLIETTVQVDKVYKDTQNELEVGQPVKLLIPSVAEFFDMGDCPAGLPAVSDPYDALGFASGNVGAEFLYAVAKNPDGASWGPPSSHLGMLDMSGTEVMSSGCPPARLEFTQNTFPVAFIAEMTRVIGNE